jgi:hypothetical protein
VRYKQFRPDPDNFGTQFPYVVGRGGTSRVNQSWLAVKDTFFGINTRAPTRRPTRR